MAKIICDAPSTIVLVNNIQDLTSKLDDVSTGYFQKNKGKGLKLAIINDKKHEKVNLDCLAILQRIGLEHLRDYTIASLQKAFGNFYPNPILHVLEGNKWELEKESFYGQEAIECFASLNRDNFL